MSVLTVLALTFAISGCSRPEPSQAVVIDLTSRESDPIGNRFGNVSIWHFLGTTADERVFHEWAEAMPDGWLAENYPWVEEVQVFAASGGSYLGHPRGPQDTAVAEFDRDHFKDPGNRAVLDDYDFSALVRACHNMLRLGVKPCLKLHNVPIKFSTDPKLDWFRMNVRPPDDHRVHAEYISALVQAMVDEFGIDEVRTWRWYIGSEFDFRAWWQAADETPETSAREFLKFYDWTVYAIERVLGSNGGPIGSHGMLTNDSLWDAEIFFEHCRSGTNYATGGTGTRLDFFGLSYYDVAATDIHSIKGTWPEFEGTGNVLASLNLGYLADGRVIRGNAELAGLREKVDTVRKLMTAHDLGDLPVEVSEGGMVYGTDGKWLWHGLAMGGSFDVSWTALSFKKLLDLDLDLWSRWPKLRTGGLFRGVEPAVTHLLRFAHEMSGDYRLHTAKPNDYSGSSEVVAGVSPDGSEVRILALHHAPVVDQPTPSENVKIELTGVRADSGRVTVRMWRVDDDHGNFWPQWEKDRMAHGITDDDFYQSRDQVDPAQALFHPEHVAFWHSMEDKYRELSRLPEPVVRHYQVRDGKLVLEFELPCFALAFFEITGLEAP